MALGDYRGPSSYKAFVRYVMASYEKQMKELSYKIYVTDMLRNIPQMTYFNARWADTLKSKEEDNRTPEQVVDDLIASLSGGK